MTEYRAVIKTKVEGKDVMLLVRPTNGSLNFRTRGSAINALNREGRRWIGRGLVIEADDFAKPESEWWRRAYTIAL